MTVEIGSRHAAAIMGVSPHLTPWQAWAQLVGILPEHEYTVHPVNRQFGAHHPERKWQRSTVDGIGWREDDGEKYVVEVKCIVTMPPAVPRVEWVVQCLHHLLVHGGSCCVLACFGGLRLVHWVIPRHERAMAALLRAEERFLKLVETETPPPVRAEDSPLLHHAWKWTRPETVVLGEEFIELDRRRGDAWAMRKQCEKIGDEVNAQIKIAMGEHERAVLPNGVRYSYLRYNRGGNPTRTLRRSGGDDE
jgi:hypothetical protein